MHQLNPNLNKDKWSLEDNRLLFNLHKIHKSHWKKIAEHFNGRTDNSIKNQFFSVVRKALRKVCKVLGNVSNTDTINKIKPKVLSNYLSLDYDIPLKGHAKCSVKVCLNEFVQKFAFSKYQELARNLSDDDFVIIRGCIDYLNILNDGYMKKKKKITKKTVKKLQTPTKKHITEANQVPEHTSLVNLDNTNTLRHLPKIIKPTVDVRRPSNPLRESAEDVVKKFETLFQNNQSLDVSQENAKDKLIGFFANLGELSYKVKNILLNSSDSGKDSMMLSNFFSVASKTRRFFNIDDNEADNLPNLKSNYNKISFTNNLNCNSVLHKSSDDENYKKLANIFVSAETGLTHQTKQTQAFNPILNQSNESNRYMEQFNRFFQTDFHNGQNMQNTNGPMIDYGISDRMGNSRLLSNIDNQSHVEVVFNEYGLGSLTNSRLLGESRNFEPRTNNQFFRSKTHSYTDKDIGNYHDM